jgi:hypothetical protein
MGNGISVPRRSEEEWLRSQITSFGSARHSLQLRPSVSAGLKPNLERVRVFLKVSNAIQIYPVIYGFSTPLLKINLVVN